MKILLYLEGEKLLNKSGIGNAILHQERALDLIGIEYTTNPNDNYDIAHINTYGPKSFFLMKKVKKQGKKLIYHGHSTKEDFRNSFIGSNTLAPLVGRYLTYLYKQADLVVTPTEYSKSLISGYGVKCPILPISNGIDLSKYVKDESKEEKFRQYFNINDNEKVVICAGLYFHRKGLDDFVKVAEKFPDVRFIWFGYSDPYTIPKEMRRIVNGDHPKNVEFPGYIKGDIYQGAMTGSDVFFFPSYEETEGIVVLEALASRQNVVLRDIPVFEDWLDDTQVSKGKNNEEFAERIQGILDGEINKKDEGYKVAESKSIDIVAQELADAYKQVINL
ncbi:glycosyltransferase family 4 protein [Floricoccus penangensis]|uniref:glycosyltransferase family 4 protein n=1 Tax=Floricoccus penangensis TaxID=1859475 RepID=UPI00203C537E|nr:glycosyltransferase family 4 protein [Floricoccus penangensis]URZ87388.1 glycosyltransferase family 4 protein [Floricoccus penangensis]